MKAIILADESGNKLYPSTPNKPKCMVKVAGNSILDYQIKALASCGIKEILIIVALEAAKVQKFCNMTKNINIKLIRNPCYENERTSYSLYLAKENLEGKSFILIHGDIVFDPKILYEISFSSAKDLIGCDKSVYQKKSMKIITNRNNSITCFGKEITPEKASATSMGLYKFSKKTSVLLFNEIKKNMEIEKKLNFSIEMVLDNLLKKHELKMKPLDTKGKLWTKINNYDDLLYADKIFSRFDRTFKNKKVIFLDLDGTIYKGNNLILGAKQFLEYLDAEGIIYYFLSNNSSRSKIDYVKKLSNLGIQTTKERIILPTDGVIEFLLKKNIKNVYIVGTDSMKKMFIKSGINVDSQKPEYIILGFDTEITYEKIKKASIFLQNGVKLIATHRDIVCPTPEGFIPDVGSMLALFEKATKKKPVKIFGKPNAEMINHVIKKYNVSPKQIAIIGDRIYTDMELARRIGCDFVCVLSGETQREEIDELDNPPALVVKNIGDII